MKKILYTVLALALALMAPFAAMAQETDTLLEGLVIEVVEGGFLLDDIEMGTVMVNTDDTTLWEGILTGPDTLEKDLYVLVHYDGRLTRSIPAQAHGDKVSCHRLMGTAGEFYETGVLLTGDELFGDVLVHLPENLPHVYANVPMTVYYDGVMALSLPGQVTARHIVVPTLLGTVSGLTEEGFTLTDGEGAQYSVLLAKETLIGEDKLKTDEDIILESTEAPLSQTLIEWGEGDTVLVYHNGMMTRSIPAQVTALEVRVQR